MNTYSIKALMEITDEEKYTNIPLYLTYANSDYTVYSEDQITLGYVKSIEKIPNMNLENVENLYMLHIDCYDELNLDMLKLINSIKQGKLYTVILDKDRFLYINIAEPIDIINNTDIIHRITSISNKVMDNCTYSYDIDYNGIETIAKLVIKEYIDILSSEKCILSTEASKDLYTYIMFKINKYDNICKIEINKSTFLIFRHIIMTMIIYILEKNLLNDMDKLVTVILEPFTLTSIAVNKHNISEGIVLRDMANKKLGLLCIGLSGKYDIKNPEMFDNTSLLVDNIETDYFGVVESVIIDTNYVWINLSLNPIYKELYSNISNISFYMGNVYLTTIDAIPMICLNKEFVDIPDTINNIIKNKPWEYDIKVSGVITLMKVFKAIISLKSKMEDLDLDYKDMIGIISDSIYSTLATISDKPLVIDNAMFNKVIFLNYYSNAMYIPKSNIYTYVINIIFDIYLNILKCNPILITSTTCINIDFFPTIDNISFKYTSQYKKYLIEKSPYYIKLNS